MILSSDYFQVFCKTYVTIQRNILACIEKNVSFFLLLKWNDANINHQNNSCLFPKCPFSIEPISKMSYAENETPSYL